MNPDNLVKIYKVKLLRFILQKKVFRPIPQKLDLVWITEEEMFTDIKISADLDTVNSVLHVARIQFKFTSSLWYIERI